MNTFHVSALPADDLDRIRARGYDDFSNPVVITTNTDGRRSAAALPSAGGRHRRARRAHRLSPVHAGRGVRRGGAGIRPCRALPRLGRSGYPDSYRHRRQLLRAYDGSGRQVDNIVVEPGRAEAGIDALLARPEVAFLHSRNVLAGCAGASRHNEPLLQLLHRAGQQAELVSFRVAENHPAHVGSLPDVDPVRTEGQQPVELPGRGHAVCSQVEVQPVLGTLAFGYRHYVDRRPGTV